MKGHWFLGQICSACKLSVRKLDFGQFSIQWLVDRTIFRTKDAIFFLKIGPILPFCSILNNVCGKNIIYPTGFSSEPLSKYANDSENWENADFHSWGLELSLFEYASRMQNLIRPKKWLLETLKPENTSKVSQNCPKMYFNT